jgi:hypothetical protein
MGDKNHVIFGRQFLVKRKFEMLRCPDATANSFVANVRAEVFAHFRAVPIERHSSMRNYLFHLSG